jgi:hypothetical protein
MGDFIRIFRNDGALMPRASRPLTVGEVALARSVFGDAIAYDRVRVNHHKWIFFQPRHIVMAPMGSLHFNPHGDLYCDDFGAASQRLQGLFIHEMTHVWQAQTRGRWYLVLMRATPSQPMATASSPAGCSNATGWNSRRRLCAITGC